MDYSKLTLGELLSDKNETVRRNALSILKVMQKQYGAITENKPHLQGSGNTAALCYCDEPFNHD